MSRKITESPRLILRTWELADAEEALVLYSDPGVARFSSVPPTQDIEKVREFIGRFMARQESRGFCPWAVIDKSTGELIGVCGLHSTHENGELEFGIRLKRDRHAQGIGTESGTLALDYAFGTLNAARVIAVASVENLPSQKLLAKLGFEFSKNTDLKGNPAMPAYEYRLDAEKWRRGRTGQRDR